MKKNIAIPFFIILVGMVFFSMYNLSSLFPIYADDWNYSFIWGKDVIITNNRVSSLSDILYSQYNHYFSWGGRVVVHSIAQFLLFIDSESLRAILNSLVYTILTVIIYKLASIKKYSFSISSYILIISILWLCSPSFFSVTIWVTGSANYLWGSVIVLLFLYVYLDYLKGNSHKKNNLFTFLFLFFGIIAGWCNESTSLSVLLFLFIFLFFQWKQKKIQKWMVSGLAGFLIGAICMFIAPGNFARLNQHMRDSDISILDSLVNHVYALFYYFLVDSYMYVAILILIFFAFYLFFFQKKKVKELIVPLSTFFIGSMAILSMLASPQFPLRTLFFPLICFVISIAGFYSNITFEGKVSKYINNICLTVLLTIYVWDWNGTMNTTKYISNFWNDRANLVEMQKKEGKTDIIFHDKFITSDSHYITYKYGIYELSSDTSNWMNRAYSRYYNIHSVKVTE